jgi:hypothetical protein
VSAGPDERAVALAPEPRPFYFILGTNERRSHFSDGGVHTEKGAANGHGGQISRQRTRTARSRRNRTDPVTQTELKNLAAAYLRLAEQAEKNSGLTIDFNLPAEDDDPKLKH